MTEIIHRLENSAPDLYSALSKSSGAELRSIALSVCTMAVSQTELAFPIIGKVMQHLRNGEQVSDQLHSELKQLVVSLDDKYLPEDLEEDVDHDASAELFFVQARAASAVLFALSDDTFVAASESTYEALAATEDVDEIARIIATATSTVS